MAVVGEKVLELQAFAENQNQDLENDSDSDFEVIEQDDLFEVVPTTEIRLIMRQSNGVSTLNMRGDTFISLSFLDQILSADFFLSKISKHFWR